MPISIGHWVRRRDAQQQTRAIDGRKIGDRLHQRARRPSRRPSKGYVGNNTALVAMAHGRKSARNTVFASLGAGKSDNPSVDPSVVDAMLLRRREAVAALSTLRATDWQDIQGNGGLLVSHMRWQPNVREPKQEHSKPAAFRGLQASHTTGRYCDDRCTISGKATRDASKNICSAAAASGETGIRAIRAASGQASRLPEFGLLFPILISK
jgi:hypothetical protein